MTELKAFTARRIFDGTGFHHDATLIVEGDRVRAVVPLADHPAGALRIDTGADILSPGFVDWQVNGGGGVLFNDAPTAAAAAAIARAHLAFGTTALLPTVITERREVTDEAAAAIAEAIAGRTPGVVGVHFEGPNLSIVRKGVHDPAFIRPFEKADFDRLTGQGLGKVVTTVATENITLDEIRALDAAGVIVSLGHTDADYETARAAFAAGARATTHLFNAMAPLHHRAPGLIGAALENPAVYCGVIADGHHVHPAVLKIIFAAGSPERLTLVTDAMSSVGDTADSFELNGRTVRRQNGRLTVADGTLAGSDLDMISAVRFSVGGCGTPLAAALRMATRNPADLLGLANYGRFVPGARADILALSQDLAIEGIWLAGSVV